MTKKIKEIHGERPKALSDEDYQAILDAEEGIFYLTMPEISEVEKRQAAARITDATLTPDAVEYFTVLAEDAKEDISKLPEGSQPLWFRKMKEQGGIR